MARNSMLPVGRSGGLGGRVVGALIVVALVALVVRDPVGAASTVERIWAFGGAVLDALTRFGAALGTSS